MIGERVGNFILESRLGRGGMGEVWLGKHVELETLVAVKLLNEQISEDRDHVQRFFNEARIVGRIRHAGTIKIFDSGFIKGHAYLVMELLVGESLATRLRRDGALPISKVLELSRQIASVLDSTHRAGVIHRDLKPDNIYIVSDDAGERIKVLDFGIAKLSGTLAVGAPQTIGTMGTPAYMAPEQWADTSLVDWRADAYSLGCVMFEMATGRVPFLANTIPEAYTKHANEVPPRVRQFKPATPAALDQMIARLLDKNPAARCASISDVVAELDALIRNPMPVATDATMAAPAGAAAIGATVATMSTASPPAAPPAVMSNTTLGGAASEVVPTARWRWPVAVIAFAALVALVTVTAVVVQQSSSPAPATRSASPAPQPAVEPSAPPPASATQPVVPVDAALVEATVDAAPAPRVQAAPPRKRPPRATPHVVPQDAAPSAPTTPPPPRPVEAAGSGDGTEGIGGRR